MDRTRVRIRVRILRYFGRRKTCLLTRAGTIRRRRNASGEIVTRNRTKRSNTYRAIYTTPYEFRGKLTDVTVLGV